jgi:hypothetical protein
MIKVNISKPRTLIMLVLPISTDLNNQEVLELVKEVDPNGIRTIASATTSGLGNQAEPWSRFWRARHSESPS